MSPFEAQVRVLRNIARKPPFEMPGVNIGPLEAFQGLESRLVILCTTRTRNRFIDQDIAKGLGVLHEPKRFNVALTRAKEGLIVIGNPNILREDENWRAFLTFCTRNGLFEGVEPPLLEAKDDVGSRVPRLERQLLFRDESMASNSEDATDTDMNGSRKLGYVENNEDALWRSGLAAEQLVKGQDG